MCYTCEIYDIAKRKKFNSIIFAGSNCPLEFFVQNTQEAAGKFILPYFKCGWCFVFLSYQACRLNFDKSGTVISVNETPGDQGKKGEGEKSVPPLTEQVEEKNSALNSHSLFQ